MRLVRRNRIETRAAVGRRSSLAFSAMLLILAAPPSYAEEPQPESAQSGWTQSTETPKTLKPSNTTVIERAGKNAGLTPLKLVALLTADGQQIDQGLVWRVFQASGPSGKSKLVSESHEASPSLKLHPGEYTINAAFGRANLTRKIVVRPDGPPFETFVLNAGGLRLSALVGGKPAPPGSVTYAIYSDDRDQFDARSAVLSNAKPNLIVRLNSGIYRIVSQYGDANAKIEADVTVEAGKLTETTVTHTGGKATFKLVTRSGGEAVPDTRWTVKTADGEIVKESVGALPTHILAPGKYVVTASSGGHLYRSDFEIKDGDVISVEVLKSASVTDNDEAGATDIAPTGNGTANGMNGTLLEFKSP